MLKNIFNKKINNKGMIALSLTFLLSAVIAIAVAIAVISVLREIKMREEIKNIAIASYLAETGLEKGKFKALGRICSSIPPEYLTPGKYFWFEINIILPVVEGHPYICEIIGYGSFREVNKKTSMRTIHLYPDPVDPAPPPDPVLPPPPPPPLVITEIFGCPGTGCATSVTVSAGAGHTFTGGRANIYARGDLNSGLGQGDEFISTTVAGTHIGNLRTGHQDLTWRIVKTNFNLTMINGETSFTIHGNASPHVHRLWTGQNAWELRFEMTLERM